MDEHPDRVLARADEIRGIAARHGAFDVRVFGSRARGEASGGSDLDLLVAFEEGRSLFDLIDLKQELEELLGCSVDIVTERSLSPHLGERVRREAVPL
jgi:hypothetical protein